ncbi:hypothetical protein RRG08_029028 [Elysia crispata]|uniref:Uncharacterized protein n=1 Tax=Elysia crispata TaxID=231223 RepID=A0AAE1AK48_9GAST|nr:hypothetical protein RRG08_029028 [Elysia crispata]
MHLRVFPILLVLALLGPAVSRAGSYQQSKSIHDALLSSATYNPTQRPLRDQDDVLDVYAFFEVVSIVEINDVVQSFKCNGFLGLVWRDEMLQWNSTDYGGVSHITPKVTSVFRPLMVLLNTLGDRDLFEDDNAPLTVFSDGQVEWVPGNIFPASCKLDLTKYPFDEQHCEIRMMIMNYDSSELAFVAESIGLTFFTENGQWDIINKSLTTPTVSVRSQTMSSVLISFDLKRKPTFLVLSILLPIVFLSLLNLLVFVIPVDSGEKISYGITVLLALTVFMSIMSGMLPSSSESMPLIISYIFILLTISVLTVVDSVIIVRLHHMEEKEEKFQKAKANYQSVVPKIGRLRVAVSPLHKPTASTEDIPAAKSFSLPRAKSFDMDLVNDIRSPKRSTSTTSKSTDKVKVNKYKLIGKHIDLVSLIVFGFAWMSVTVGFMASITAR